MQSDQIGDWVLYKNNQLIVFNKPAGLAVQQRGKEKSILDLAEIYTKQKLYLIHRLDQPASGVILFAKNPKALAHLNDQFKNRQVDKYYLAAVAERPPQDSGTLVHFLKKNGRINKSFAVAEGTPGAKRAEMKYTLLGQSDRYHFLRIELITGRHHQVRAQLAAIGCPIKGDVKYGFRRANPDRSIHLHAWKLRFRHPVGGEEVVIEAPLPDDPVWNSFEWKIENE